jgi:hypothetical protein
MVPVMVPDEHDLVTTNANGSTRHFGVKKRSETPIHYIPVTTPPSIILGLFFDIILGSVLSPAVNAFEPSGA